VLFWIGGMNKRTTVNAFLVFAMGVMVVAGASEIP
jgi:hypothetical protein